MIPNPTPTTFIIMILGVLSFIFITLLPALLELKRPKDAGPRLIINDVPVLQPQMRESILIVNVEEDHRLDQTLVKKIADIIAVLPNLEA